MDYKRFYWIFHVTWIVTYVLFIKLNFYFYQEESENGSDTSTSGEEESDNDCTGIDINVPFTVAMWDLNHCDPKVSLKGEVDLYIINALLTT